ncbi:MAG: murein L,D-transpeptidase [Verrucomicrobiae bacterium]|nr:murein L,D-transpeptidase [Verrucomicrobiae bacterium]
MFLLVVIAVGLVSGWLWIRRPSPPETPSSAVRPSVVPVPLPPTVRLPETSSVPPIAESPPPQPTPATPDPIAPPPPTNPPAVVVAPEVPSEPLPEPTVPWSPRPATNMLETQVALAQIGIGSGPVDGVGGAQTEAALRAFQFREGLQESGSLDRDTRKALRLHRAPLTRYEVTHTDLAQLSPVPDTWLGKSQVSTLGFASLLELVGERTQTHPKLLRRLNPGVAWESVAPGTSLVVPDASYPPPRRAALVRISLAGRHLRAYDEQGHLLVHFPVSIGRLASKRPVGSLRVIVAIENPNYTFDPAVFPESEEGRRLGRKLVLPPGPNNPVGVAWIGLNRPGYGIHGTPVPELVGRTESHGCFRLANWNADHLRRMVSVGTRVNVER